MELKSTEFQRMLEGYGVTTAYVEYYLPDQPHIIAPPLIWQFDDLHPHFPRLMGFLDHWDNEVEARIASIRVAHKNLITPAEFRFADGLLHLH